MNTYGCVHTEALSSCRVCCQLPDLPAGLLTHLQTTDWHMLRVHAMTMMMKSSIPVQKPAVQECQSLGRLLNQCAGA